MNESHPNSPPRRLQELLTIPERQRTEAEWEEINELEISLTPINREVVLEPAIRRNAVVPEAPLKPSSSARHKRAIKKSHKRSKKTSAP